MTRHGPATESAEWDEFYTERSAIWSGEPNAQLVAEVSDLSPGTALDVGCGEGADAVWLAQRGWSVTAVDISEVALERARGHADSAGAFITLQRADLVSAPPAPDTYDLVSAQFFQLPEPPRGATITGLGRAVTPGGHLLVVGHDPSGRTGSDHPERLFGTKEIAELFSPGDWEVVTADVRDRRAMHHGEMTDLRDGVVLLRRAR